MIFLLLFHVVAHAISDEKLKTVCLEAGILKMAETAKNWHCKFQEEDVEVKQIYNLPANPTSYVWYQAPAECSGSHRDVNHLMSMAQYAKGKCF